MTTRALSPKEIAVLLHLLKFGGCGEPILLPPFGRGVATGLWREGLVNAWQRQSLHGGRSEGPFHSLTGHGRQRAFALLAARERRQPVQPSLASARIYQAYRVPHHHQQEGFL